MGGWDVLARAVGEVEVCRRTWMMMKEMKKRIIIMTMSLLIVKIYSIQNLHFVKSLHIQKIYSYIYTIRRLNRLQQTIYGIYE